MPCGVHAKALARSKKINEFYEGRCTLMTSATLTLASDPDT